MSTTTATTPQIVTVILRTLRELGEQGVVDVEGVELGPEVELFGEEGLLDSVGLVSLIVAVEQEIEDELGVHVALADERALSQRNSPYRTVASLAEYAATVTAQ